MFVTTLDGHEGSQVTVIGAFERIDGNYVILRTVDSQIKVEHKGLGNYKSKYVLVSGVVSDATLVEEYTHAVEDDFNCNTYDKLVAVSRTFPEIF